MTRKYYIPVVSKFTMIFFVATSSDLWARDQDQGL